MANGTQDNKIYLTCIHHSDLTWQFPFAEYDAIREQQLNIVMDFFEKHPDYTFIFDQAYVLQNYLERNPQRKEAIMRAFQNGEGGLELVGQYSIPDLNLCSGESLIRNIMLGRRYYRENFGCEPQTASLMDAFGMPFQVPQILSKLGYRYLLPGRTPNAAGGFDTDKPYVWKGMGDTELVVVPNGAGVDCTSYITNVPVTLNEEERFLKTLRDLQNMEGNVLAYYMTEIQMLNAAFFQYLEQVNGESGANRQVTFGRLQDYCKTLDVQSLPVYTGEFNPVFSGCYTTRISVKQKIRKVENTLYAAELASALTGMPAGLEEAWHQLALAQFHDSACGCHHDSCNEDVNEKLNFAQCTAESSLECLLSMNAGNTLTVLNSAPYGQISMIETQSSALPADIPAQKDGDKYCFCAQLPASGTSRFQVDPDAEPALVCTPDISGYCGETDCFAFDFSDPMPKITSKRFKKQVFGQEKFGEILFRHESGSMWDELLREVPCGAEYEQERVTAVEEGPVFVKVTTEGCVKPGRTPISGNTGDYWPGFASLSFTKEYIFPVHLPYFKLRLHLNFTGYNTKISLRIPVALNPLKAAALYDTPFAAVQRKPYFEVPYRYRETAQTLASPGDYDHARGDYPALHWVDYSDDQIGIAVANNGTPGHQLVGEDIFISLLRSGTCCKDGTMYPQPGSFENGEHVFEFALTDHLPTETDAAIRLGAVMNRKPLCVTTGKDQTPAYENLVSFDASNIVISAIYPQQDGVVVRAYEALGRDTCCAMCCPEKTVCYASDMYARELSPQDAGAVAFTPYEIKTFLLKKA